ncbi:hypothetical protein Ancab_037926 [Ancistrocladus abbreviatus]
MNSRRERETRGGEMETTHLLEVNLISAQGLNSPVSKFRHLRTYAIVWVNPSAKLRTRIDRVGGSQPTWNDKFIFRVTSDFLNRETSGVTVEIYAVGVLKDPLIGSVHFLVSNFLPSGFSLNSTTEDSPTPGIDTPVFNAFQIRRPSGRFFGILNVGAMVITRSDFAGLTGISAIGYRDLMGKKSFNTKKKTEHGREHEGSEAQKSDGYSVDGSCAGSCADSAEFSDGFESTASATSSSNASRATPSFSPRILKELNGMEEVAGTKDDHGGGVLCGLGFQKKVHISASDENLRR